MRHQHPGGLTLTKKMIDRCAFPAGTTVVDVGCGTGATVECLRDSYGLKAIGIDTSKERLKQGRKRAAELLLLQGCGERLPFIDNSVGGAVMECSLSLMKNTARVLAEMYRILIRGGRLGITDLYIVHHDCPPSACYLPVMSDEQNGLSHPPNLLSLLQEANFRILTWEDQSACLKEFIAAYIMQHGFTEEERSFFPYCGARNILKEQTMKVKLGYFLLIAEKE